MKELTLTGSPYEQGVQHGQSLKDVIRVSVGNSLGKPVLLDLVSYLDRLFPEINEEIRGIADGSGMPFEAICAFNNRSLLNRAEEGCCAVAIVRDGHVVAGMNKDLPSPDAVGHFVRRSIPSKGYASIGYGHIGRLWGYGVNEKGLCAAGTSARPLDASVPVPSLGLYFIGPLLLNKCATTADAVDLILRMDRLGESGNVLLADTSGDAVVVEVSPGQRVVRRAEEGVVVATNFYASGEIPHEPDQAYLDESAARSQHITAMAGAPAPASVETMQSILTSHEGQAPVCRHNSLGMTTQFSWIAEPGIPAFRISAGHPCANEYKIYGLN